MKKSVAALVLLTLTSSAFAHGNYVYRPAPYYHGHYGHHNHWIAPAIIGGVIGYTLARPPVYSYPPPPPVIVAAPEPVPAYPPPQGYHYEQRLDGGCNCWRWFIVPNTP